MACAGNVCTVVFYRSFDQTLRSIKDHVQRRTGAGRRLRRRAVLACVAINLTGTSVNHFWLALVLLGISWNFLFIGATTMLTDTYRTEERFKTQAVNDFIVFSTVASASLSAGALQHHFGWQAVNIGAIPALLIILLSLLWLRFSHKPVNDFPDSDFINAAATQTEG